MASQAATHLRARIATNIRAAQSARGLTGRQIADAVGASPDQVAKWRLGRVTPGPERLMQLAAVLTDGDVSAFYAQPEPEEAAA